MKLLYLLIVAALLTACGGKKDDKKDGGSEPLQQQNKAKGNTISFTPEQNKNGGIDTGKLPMRLLNAKISVNGQVDVPPENLIAVNVPMGGFLKRTTMLPGEHVVKGQIIAQIENQEYITIQQDYLTSVSKITFLKQEMERQKVLSQQQASPLKLYQQSQSEYNSELAQAAGLAQKLRMIGIDAKKLTPATIRSVVNIPSPITGYVSKVNVSVGKFTNPTDVLMELVNTDDIHAALTVFEQDISKITIGNSVDIKLPSVPGKTYPGKIILIGRVLDSTRSVMVHCHFLKTDKNLLPNMFIQATINTKPQNTLAVPDAALVNYSGQKGIFIATKQGPNIFYSLLPVKIGIQQDGWNQISLIKPELKDHTFVLKGAFSILSAMKNTGDDSE
ncbi:MULTISPECIES: efflux RND transporter periplasmic adaptor subunit [unclassified Mucilaginibacter]|uniref:efflux RND transporter periplasmic adaptor subunit n=1 Tax=unclassified Mucilaginibacter TaxID=2617802 RepID=UPI002AC8B151|nr:MULTISPECIES: efflux RND transporter periplasmic adaptor subunit [unclassified Mucilaginibacter]MEB0261910.1 efflux RND transporter periplasmic adaptor subunit [Mucilaginibacter sp. 10I4]MEB0277639.1 efflux RND transporter periplasmic adaptor subunit [Mucilaginibacter sp. 10B2]MEB0299554.1 efflux RND transporter periplasmic adaptor subunit [Mucilaginibacter sp. 5C4]WPX24734.1 efflux RND transporter periplasmic adaptor subunit [Mucilaginibacter sp. 5C4]